MGIMERVILQLEEFGLTDVLLPFFLVFTILFASLEKIKIFTEKKINVLVSLVIALLVVIPHVTHKYPPGTDVVEIINNAIPGVAAVVVALIMLFIILGLFFGEKKFEGARVGGWVSILAIIVILWIFGSAAGWWVGFDTMKRWLGNDVISLIVILLVFGIVIRMIVGGTDKKTGGEKYIESIGKFFGGGK